MRTTAKPVPLGLGLKGVESLVDGFDVAVLDADGKITTVLGSLDKVPA